MKKYLVTGGAGFIGSHIVQRLLQYGHYVRVLDNFSSGKEENLNSINVKYYRNFELIKGDITDKKTCVEATKDIKCILHQAGLKSVPQSFDCPSEYNNVNVNGTLNLLEASVKNKVKTFVFASSSSVYGDVKKFPQKEESKTNPLSPYALSKLMAEYYCEIFSKIHNNLNTVSLRYFNVFGPRQSMDDEYSVVIPSFITSILNDKQPIIYGNGKQSRDFTFVDDVVNANLFASKVKNLKGQRFNIATGKNISILDLLQTINKITRKNIKPIFKPERRGDVFKSLADIKKAKKIIKYKPLFNLERGLTLTVDWFK
jgi:nucleoside-diphosphate-sugar epimerase